MAELRKRRSDRGAMQGGVGMLSYYPPRISEWILASIQTEKDYPELSEAFGEMAVLEAEQFRVLGGGMLRKGMNPPLRSLLLAGRGGCASLSAAEGRELARFLRRMREQTEQMGEELAFLLSLPEWEGEPWGEQLRRNHEKQLRRLGQMLS